MNRALHVFLILTLTTLSLSSCAWSQRNRHPSPPMTRSELKKALKEDWRARRQTEEVRNQAWDTCTQRTEPESVCSRAHAPNLAAFKLDKFYPEPGAMDVATALYCPQEDRYWVEQTAGEEELKCRLLGPFSLDNKGGSK